MTITQTDVVVTTEQQEQKMVTHVCFLCGYKEKTLDRRDQSGLEILPPDWIFLPDGLKSCSTTMFPTHPSPKEAAPGRGLLQTGYIFWRMKCEERLGIKRVHPFEWDDPHQGD